MIRVWWILCFQLAITEDQKIFNVESPHFFRYCMVSGKFLVGICWLNQVDSPSAFFYTLELTSSAFITLIRSCGVWTNNLSNFLLQIGSHGDLIEEEGKSVPFRVEILHMHRLVLLEWDLGFQIILRCCKNNFLSFSWCFLIVLILVANGYWCTECNYVVCFRINVLSVAWGMVHMLALCSDGLRNHS